MQPSCKNSFNVLESMLNGNIKNDFVFNIYISRIPRRHFYKHIQQNLHKLCGKSWQPLPSFREMRIIEIECLMVSRKTQKTRELLSGNGVWLMSESITVLVKVELGIDYDPRWLRVLPVPLPYSPAQTNPIVNIQVKL